MHKVLIGLVSYNDLHYLSEVAPILEQLRKTLPADVCVLDTAHNHDVKMFFRDEYPEFYYIRHADGNIGYGRGYSEILRKNPGHKYLLVCTNDVLLNASVIKEAVKMMEKKRSVTMCVGKLYHWDFEENVRTQIIDSFGIAAEKRHHFYDRGAGELDEGQYDDTLEDVFGISGATFLIRTAVIPKLHGEDWRLFDERMWMYKEDIDLSYRLRWLDEKLLILPKVWGWHARTASNMEGQGTASLVEAQKKKADYTRKNSYKNHLLMIRNNFSWRFGFAAVLRLFFFESSKAVYMLFRHPSVFFEAFKSLLFVRGRSSTRQASPREVFSYFN